VQRHEVKALDAEKSKIGMQRRSLSMRAEMVIVAAGRKAIVAINSRADRWERRATLWSLRSRPDAIERLTGDHKGRPHKS